MTTTQKPFVIPIFIPHAGCPHRCVFCDQTRTTSQDESLPSASRLDEIIAQYLSYRKDAGRYTEISFYGGNFLGLPSDDIAFFLERAARYVHQGLAQGIRFSTRPDTIDPGQLKQLARFPVTTIELGVQSMNDQVLSTVCRGHSVRHIAHAVALLRSRPYRLGLQMMVGLPGDTRASAMATGARIADLAPDFVRIYPTLVLKGSALARWYRQGRYVPLTLEDAVAQVKDLYKLFCTHHIKVIRMGLQATDGLDAGADLVAGPYHPAFGELVQSGLWLDAMVMSIRAAPSETNAMTIRLHPRIISRVKGHKNKNMETLTRRYNLPSVTIAPDETLPMDVIHLNDHPCPLL